MTGKGRGKAKTPPRAAAPIGFRSEAADRPRQLRDLVSVGPATVADLNLLGVHTVAQLAEHEPLALYEELCARTGARHDPCCLDVFCAAVAQARDPQLPEEQRNWWYWSRLRRGSPNE